MRPNRYRRRGFSLSELLVAIVIAAVLVGLTFSVVAGVKRKASGARCVGNIRTIVMALLSYANDNENRLPTFDDMPTQGNNWWRRIQPYMGYPVRNVGSDKDQDTKFRCSEEKDSAIVSTIGANYGFIIDYADMERHNGSMKVSAIPASAYLVGECKGPVPAIYNPGWWRFSADSDGDGVLDSDSRLREPYNHFAFRHEGVGFAGFADGAVRSVTKRDWAANANSLWGPYYNK